MNKVKLADLFEVLTAQDGQFNDELNAYVTAYVYDTNKVAIELEYVDIDNDHEVIQVIKFRVIVEDENG